MTMTIEEAAKELAARLDIPTPDGESSIEFRLSFARLQRIGDLIAELLRLANGRTLRTRYPDGGYLPEYSEVSESSQVDIAEAQTALDGMGWKFAAEESAASSGAPDIDEYKAETPSRTTEQYKASWPTCTKHELIDGFQLTGKNWEDTLSRPSKYDSAKRQPGRKGKGGEAIWCPLTFAALLVTNEDCTQSQVQTRFLKVTEWRKWESELLAEIGMI
jgi:hypothetical protein